MLQQYPANLCIGHWVVQLHGADCNFMEQPGRSAKKLAPHFQCRTSPDGLCQITRSIVEIYIRYDCLPGITIRRAAVADMQAGFIEYRVAATSSRETIYDIEIHTLGELGDSPLL